jgi:hypothetical protein
MQSHRRLPLRAGTANFIVDCVNGTLDMTNGLVLRPALTRVSTTLTFLAALLDAIALLHRISRPRLQLAGAEQRVGPASSAGRIA